MTTNKITFAESSHPRKRQLPKWEYSRMWRSIPMATLMEKISAKIAEIQDLESRLETAKQDFESMVGGSTRTKSPKSPKSPKSGKTKVRGRPKGSKNTAPKVANRRNDMPLTKMIPGQVLEGKKGGATHSQVVEDVLKKGYEHSSKDFSNVVYQTLRKLVRNEEVVELEVEQGAEPLYALPKYVE